MKKFKKVLSPIMAFLMLISSMQFPNMLSLTPVADAAHTSAPVGTVVSTMVYTDAESVALDEAWLSADLILNGNSYETYELYDGTLFYYNITSNLNTPVSGEHGSTISWTSSDEALVALNGTVTRPTYLQGTKDVILTATISKGEAQIQKTFMIAVMALEATPDEAVAKADYDWLTEDIIHYGRFADDIREDVNLPAQGENGSTISWTSSHETVVNVNGTVYQPTFAQGNTAVTLTATIIKGEVQLQKTFEVTVISLEPTDVDKVAIDKAWLTDELVSNGNNANDVKTKLYLPTYREPIWSPSGYYGGSTITWESSNTSVIATDGRVTRPTEAQGNQSVTLTATITNGDAVDTKTFDFIVTVVEEFPLGINYDDFGNLGDRLQFNGVSGITDTLDREGTIIKALQFNNDGQALGGSVFTKNRVHLADDLSFSTAFSYRNPHPDFTLGTGGFTFTLQAVDSTVYGQSLDAEHIKPGLSIAFVTDYYSSPGPGQGTTYTFSESAAVYYNGDYDNRTAWALTYGSTNNPAVWNNVWIEYNGTSKVMEVRYSSTTERPTAPDLRLENVDLGQIFTSADTSLTTQDVQNVYAGFTGSVGNARDKSEIGNWYFRNDSTPVDFAPYNFIDASNVTLNANPPAGASSSTVTVSVYGNGGPVSGLPVEFATSLGTLDVTSAITDSSGQASTLLTTNTSGVALVKAIAAGGATATTEVQLMLSESDKVFFDREWLTDERILNGNTALNNITQNLSLPTLGLNGSAISWDSSNESVVALDGTVNRPTFAQGDQGVTLTATISRDGIELQKSFDVIVKVLDGDLAAADRDWLTPEQMLGEQNSTLDNVIANLSLPTLGPNGSSISWVSSSNWVASKGVVTRPTYTQGDKTVTLTATICKASVVLEKTFEVTVKALEPTESEAAYTDYLWLTEEIILNGNNSLENVTGNLNLPVIGPLDTVITWVYLDESWQPRELVDGYTIEPDGTVNRPLYAEGNKSVKLEATVSKGSFEYNKIFYITVEASGPTDAEAVALDNTWLTDMLILNGNTHLGRVVSDVYLPVQGPQETTISWTSTNEEVVALDGRVTRLSWARGNRLVTLTATLSKGNASVQKAFIVYVPSLEQTIQEAVQAATRWLSASHTLEENLSQYSITQDLVLPDSGIFGTSITWTTNNPAVISNSGVVTRPEYGEGNKSVQMTATLAKEGVQESKVITYTVLQKPDTFVPEILGVALPTTVSGDVYWDAREIILTFDEEVKKGTDAVIAASSTFGIKLLHTGTENSSDISVRVGKNEKNELVNLIISPLTDMPFGENELAIPAGAVADLAGNPMAAYSLKFNVEQKQLKTIAVNSSTPQDRSKDVSLTPAISLTFSDSHIVKGSTFANISLRTKAGKVIPVTATLSGDTVTLKRQEVKGVEVPLEPGVVYELIIPAGAVRDRFENESLAKTILFRTVTSEAIPEITSFYPLDGQRGVDVHQSIEVEFSETVKAKDCKLTLRDNQGNLIKTYVNNSSTSQNVVLVEPYEPLKPNTQYTLAGPYDSALSPSELDFTVSFTTGANALSIEKVCPTSNQLEVPINASVEVQFSSPVTRGAEFSKIVISDSAGNPVSFNGEEVGNKVVLTPIAPLDSEETYSMYLPGGAYKNAANGVNDAIEFKFATARDLAPDSFVVNPSTTWLVKKPITFSTAGIENTFKEAGYEITSMEWSFGDGGIGSSTNPKHIYDAIGDYLVTLRIQDNKGFSYQFEQSVTIQNFDLSNVTMSVRHIWSDTVYVKSTSRSNTNKLYNIHLLSDGNFVPGETIGVQLFKNGVLQKDFGTITTNGGGNAYEFPFYYEGYGYLGTYELVFTFNGQAGEKVVREPVIIREAMAKETMRIKLYDRPTWKYSEELDSLVIWLNGERKVAEKEWHSDKDGYCYMLRDIPAYQWYNFEIEGWTTNSDRVFHQGSLNAKVIPGELTKPGVNRVTCFELDLLRVMEGVDVGPLNFLFDGYWNGLEPGYYEMRSDSDRFNIKSASRIIKFNPGKVLHAGEHLQARMVAKNGAKSPWKFVAQVMPKPSLGIGPELKFSIVDRAYRARVSMGFADIMGEKISLLDNVPLLNGTPSFGISKDDLVLEGILDNTATIKLDFEGGGSYEKTTKMKKKKTKMWSAGYEISADMMASLALKYNWYSGKWDIKWGSFGLEGYGGYRWTKGYRVPKVGVGVDGTVKLGSYVNGYVKIITNDSGTKKYQGIIGMRPIVNVSIQGGPDWVNVTGYAEAGIPAEIHIPTGYIEAGVDVTAGITATFLTYTQKVLELDIYKTHWDNGKPKVLRSMILVTDPTRVETDSQAELEPMPRDYLNRPSKWLADNQGDEVKQFAAARVVPLMLDEGYKSAAIESNPNVVTLMENVFPDAKVQLIRNGDELWLVWVDDNPERTPANRTQMRYAVLKDGLWSEPQWIGQDGTSDFTPVSASTGQGLLMAWQNMKQDLPEEADLGLAIESAEISVTESVYKADGSAVELVTLTNDDKFDHSPKLVADGDKALLVWTKSEGLGWTLGTEMEEYRAPENSDRLLYSGWDGSTWSTPVEIEGSLPTVMNTNLNLHGEEGLLLYTLDMDNDQSTQEDRELFARIHDGTSWGEAIRITNNQVPDANPRAVYTAGQWFITWHQDGNIVYQVGVDGESKTEEFLNNLQSEYEIAVKEGTKPQIALVYKRIDENRVHNLSTSFYDLDSGVWSEEIPLSEDEGYVSSFSPVFTEDGKLDIAYTEAAIVTEVKTNPETNEEIEYKNVSDKVDLRRLTYTPVHDLALEDEDGLQVFPEIPLPGTLTTVTATIRNRGDFAERATLSLYDGAPGVGVKIGEVTTAQPIPARSSAEVEVEWLVGLEEKNQYDIYAVVQPEEGVTENDETNNAINHRISTADMAITSLNCENLAEDDYLVTATVTNSGSRSLEGVRVQLDQGLGINVLEGRELRELRPGEEEVVSLLVSSQGLTKDENNKANMTFRVLLPDGVEDNYTDDNTYDFEMEPAPIVVDSVTGLDENQGDLEDTVTIGFNMKVEEGTEFDQILLEDDDLNVFTLNKTLEGNTLKLTPQMALEPNTRYTLTIPQKALGDAYGHTMDESYSTSFTTTASSPEVVFAYPGDEMVEVAPDTEIKVQFNQEVLQGPNFEAVALYGPDSEEISVSASLQGEWLYIYPPGPLSGNKKYSLVIPRGAVKNDKGEVQQEDFTLKFTTLKSENRSGGSGSGGTVYTITRQTLPDGRSTAIIGTDPHSLLRMRSANEAVAILDVTDKVKNDEIVQINLTEDVLTLLKSNKLSFKIVTGKGDVTLPAELLKSLIEKGIKSASVSIAQNNEKLTAKDSVSTGMFDFSLMADGNPVDKFEPPVLVTIPLDKSKVRNAKRVIVCVYDEDTGRWQPVGGVADAEQGSVTFKTGHFSTYAAFETIKKFEDVTAAWAKEKVETLASRHLIYGTSDKTFNPEGSITRAEFTTLIVRSLYAEYVKGKGTFKDVAKGSWYADAVETACDLGLVAGTGTGNFDPNRKISREQLATIAYRLYQYRTGTETNTNEKTNPEVETETEAIDKKSLTFEDRQDISSYAEEAVGFVSKAGIMIGNGGSFKPQRSTTRQEAAVVLYKLLEYMGEM